MKKIMAMLLAAVMVFSMVGCGSKEEDGKIVVWTLAKDLTQFLFCCIFCISSDNFLFDCVLFYFCVFYH